MHVRVSHQTVYRYDRGVAAVVQIARLTPRSHDGQYVRGWRVEVSAECRMATHEDAFGNITHLFTAEGPLGELVITAEGDVETINTHGIIRGAVERFPPGLFLRDTALTIADAGIRDFARTVCRRCEGDRLGMLHALLSNLHAAISFDTGPTTPTTSAAEAFALRRGVCQDLAHIFIAAARSLRIPARYVSGYFQRADGINQQEAGHAWAEAFVADLGWVGFDPANGICPSEAHVRVAVGLDYLGAAPVRGSRYGGGGEVLEVAIHLAQAAQSSQA